MLVLLTPVVEPDDDEVSMVSSAHPAVARPIATSIAAGRLPHPAKSVPQHGHAEEVVRTWQVQFEHT